MLTTPDGWGSSLDRSIDALTTLSLGLNAVIGERVCRCILAAADVYVGRVPYVSQQHCAHYVAFNATQWIDV